MQSRAPAGGHSTAARRAGRPPPPRHPNQQRLMRPSPPHPSPSPAYPRALDRRRSDRTGSAASRLVIVSPGGRGRDEVPNRTRTRITLHNTHWHGEYSEGGAGREALAPNAPGRTVTSRASAASVQPKQPAADSRRVAEPRTRNRDSRLGPKYATRRPGPHPVPLSRRACAHLHSNLAQRLPGTGSWIS